MKIQILRGISCSGKSTYCQHKTCTIISRDLIRQDLLDIDIDTYFNEGMDYFVEEVVTVIEHKKLAQAICKGKDIIIDNTNLRKKYVQEYVDVFNDLGVSVEDVRIIDFPITLEEAKERSKNREGKVTSNKVLEKQFEQFNSINWGLEDFIKDGKWISSRDKKKWHYTSFDVKPYVPFRTEPAIIVDIDGTLAHRKVVDGKMRSFFDYPAAMSDDVDKSIKWLIENISHKAQIIIVSGRMDSSDLILSTWLKKKAGINDFIMYMRKEGDTRSDDIVKYEIFNEHIREFYDVKFVIDDRDRVCAMWQELGLKVLNVGDLNESF